MRAFDVVWGSTKGRAVIQNNYVEVTDVVITSGESRIRTAGRFSIGYPAPTAAKRSTRESKS